MKKWLDDLYAILLKRGLPTLDNSLKNYEHTEKLLNNNKYYLINTITIETGNTYILDLSELGITGNRFFTLLGLTDKPHCFITKTFKQYSQYYYIPLTPTNSAGFSVSFSSERYLSITNTTSSNLSVSLYYIYSPYTPI